MKCGLEADIFRLFLSMVAGATRGGEGWSPGGTEETEEFQMILTCFLKGC